MIYGWGTDNTNNTDVIDYDSAVAYLSRGRNKDQRPLQWETILYKHDDGSISVKYHEIDVVTYHPDGGITFDSGGWKTQTTKRRMNDYTSLSIDTEQGVWSVGKWGDQEFERVTFEDGMTILPDKTARYVGDPPSEKEILALRKRVSGYAKKFADNLEGIGLPDGGDCWICIEERNETWRGDPHTGSAEHLLSHIEEDYFVPSLVFAALKESNYGDYYGYMIQEVMAGNRKLDSCYKTDMARFIRKYIQRRLGLSVG